MGWADDGAPWASAQQEDSTNTGPRAEIDRFLTQVSDEYRRRADRSEARRLRTRFRREAQRRYPAGQWRPWLAAAGAMQQFLGVAP